MVTELEPVMRQLFHDMDREDFNAVSGYFANDVRAIEEIQRRWMRGSSELKDYLAQLKPLVTDIRSRLADFDELTWGDAGLVTCWLDQTYVLDGNEQHISAPTTFVFRRDEGIWNVVLIHSVPLPAET